MANKLSNRGRSRVSPPVTPITEAGGDKGNSAGRGEAGDIGQGGDMAKEEEGGTAGKAREDDEEDDDEDDEEDDEEMDEDE